MVRTQKLYTRARRRLRTYLVTKKFLADKFRCDESRFDYFSPTFNKLSYFSGNARINNGEADEYRAYKPKQSAVNFGHATISQIVNSWPDKLYQDVLDQQRVLVAEGFIKTTKKLASYMMPPEKHWRKLISRGGQLHMPPDPLNTIYDRVDPDVSYPLVDSSINTPDAIKKVLDLLEAHYNSEDYYRSIVSTLVPYLTLNQILNTCNGLHPTT